MTCFIGAGIAEIVTASYHQSGENGQQGHLGGKMVELVVGPVLGRITETSIRILIEVDQSGDVEVVLRSLGQQARRIVFSLIKMIPKALLIGDLTSGREYEVEIAVLNGSSRIAKFRTPDDSNLRFACVSCYKFSDNGMEASAWKPLAQRSAAGEIDVVLHMGDQIYSDAIFRGWVTTLADKTSEQRAARVKDIRESYRNLYREAWNQEDVQVVLRHASNLMIWDDHEVTDDWGDRNVFAQSDTVEHLIATCAWEIYLEYQRQLWDEDALMHPLGEHEGHVQYWGSTAVLFVDVRGGRAFQQFNHESSRGVNLPESPYLGAQQWQSILNTLNPQTQIIKNLILVCPVPLVFTVYDPVYTWKQDDLKGHWSYPIYREEQMRMLSALRNWKEQGLDREVVILGGDVHAGCVFDIDYANGSFQQLLSGPVHKHMITDNELLAYKLIITNPIEFGRFFTARAHSVTKERNYGTVSVIDQQVQLELIEVK